MIERLRAKNCVNIYSVQDDKFKSYGRVLEGFDFSELTEYMEHKTAVPETGNVYIPSVLAMENMEACRHLKNIIYGGMPIQIGYCNGRNSTYNGFEYHKGSEINIAVTDFMLVLGHTWDIEDNTYDAEKADVFYVERGTAIEMYQTTLHLSPCRICDEGFKDIVILPEGTNTPLADTAKEKSFEGTLLLMKNKWVLAHPEREPLIKQGAHPGMLGENRELYY